MLDLLMEIDTLIDRETYRGELGSLSVFPLDGSADADPMIKPSARCCRTQSDEN